MATRPGFSIHEDPSTEEDNTQMNGEAEEAEVASSQAATDYAEASAEADNDMVGDSTTAAIYGDDDDDDDDGGEEAGDGDGEDGEDGEDEAEDERDESSDEEPVDEMVQHDMERLQNTFPGFRQQFRLLKRIGEGTFSTVYKAEDLQYEKYDNSWDWDKEREKWTPPPLKRRQRAGGKGHGLGERRRRPKFVAIKKIYVTSSPLRIFNELELLHDLRASASVCPLITAFRQADQVVAVLPYFRHQDFREYYRRMTVPDMAIYLHSLFTALAAVHRARILHRDIKPTNFLYDPGRQRGVLVDFGLAEREGSDSKPCLCHEHESVRKARLRAAAAAGVGASVSAGSGAGGNTIAGLGLAHHHNGYPKNDTRPARRANRAGTRGFRAPEVLFKCTEQTTKIDIWSAGVILLTLLSRRFPFFNSADDVEALIEIATIFGSRRMKLAAQLHGCMLDTTIPTVGREGFSLEKIILWSNCRIDNGKTVKPLSEDERLAVRFLERCLDLDPRSRISAEDALDHEFLQLRPRPLGTDIPEDDDEMDML